MTGNDSTSDELRPDVVLLGERNYEAALDLIFARAERELLIFDQHLRLGAYQSEKRFMLIQDFLRKNPQNHLQMILHEADFFSQQCPRFFDLLKSYGHAMNVWLTNDHAKIAKDCFVIADGLHTIRRIHIDHARFRYTFDNIETATTLRHRFDEILSETSTPMTATMLGL
ncbi:MAG TPA: hypothetical protein PLR90_08980 [Methylophilus sp.]|nr:hypothetical protein [Methylophilus sp.]HQQ34037.1 hypothetical protein [Methylophilus sp.]